MIKDRNIDRHANIEQIVQFDEAALTAAQLRIQPFNVDRVFLTELGFALMTITSGTCDVRMGYRQALAAPEAVDPDDATVDANWTAWTFFPAAYQRTAVGTSVWRPDDPVQLDAVQTWPANQGGMGVVLPQFQLDPQGAAPNLVIRWWAKFKPIAR